MYEIKADGETAMGSWYLIDGKEDRKLTRSLGGPVEFYMEMGDKKIELGKVVYGDVFKKDGDYWLPRCAAGVRPGFSLD